MRTIALCFLFVSVIFVAGCPRPEAGTPVAPPDTSGRTAPAQPPQDMRSSVSKTLTENVERLEARLEWYRENRPDHPDLDRAEGLLKDARAGILGLADVPEADLPEKMHAVNTMMYNTERIIPDPGE